MLNFVLFMLLPVIQHKTKLIKLVFCLVLKGKTINMREKEKESTHMHSLRRMQVNKMAEPSGILMWHCAFLKSFR